MSKVGSHCTALTSLADQEQALKAYILALESEEYDYEDIVGMLEEAVQRSGDPKKFLEQQLKEQRQWLNP